FQMILNGIGYSSATSSVDYNPSDMLYHIKLLSIKINSSKNTATTSDISLQALSLMLSDIQLTIDLKNMNINKNIDKKTYNLTRGILYFSFIDFGFIFEVPEGSHHAISLPESVIFYDRQDIKSYAKNNIDYVGLQHNLGEGQKIDQIVKTYVVLDITTLEDFLKPNMYRKQNDKFGPHVLG
ncbi:hypothetical protein ACJX0J_013619, partial [Zea mays]